MNYEYRHHPLIIHNYKFLIQIFYRPLHSRNGFFLAEEG